MRSAGPDAIVLRIPKVGDGFLRTTLTGIDIVPENIDSFAKCQIPLHRVKRIHLYLGLIPAISPRSLVTIVRFSGRSPVPSKIELDSPQLLGRKNQIVLQEAGASAGNGPIPQKQSWHEICSL